MATIDEMLNVGPGDQLHNLDFGKALATLIGGAAKTHVYLDEILKRQIELKALIENRPISDDHIRLVFEELNKQMGEFYVTLITSSTK